MRDLKLCRDYALKIKQEGLGKQDMSSYIDWSTDVILEATERAIRAEENNPDPLALEELKQLDGKPVYVQFGDGEQGWAVVEVSGEYIILYGPDFPQEYPDMDFYNMEHNDPAGHYGLHVLGWRAYKCKPKEDA